MRALLVLGIAGAVVFAWMAQQGYTIPGIGTLTHPVLPDPSDPGYITTGAGAAGAGLGSRRWGRTGP